MLFERTCISLFLERTLEMDNLRKRDPKLLGFKTSKTITAWTRQCSPAMRQPIIINNLEIENMKKRNPSGFEKIADTITNWGSSNKTSNHYICPRLWCIKCKLVLTEKQLLDNDKKCPFCNGAIINEKKMKKGETIILRKHKYWHNTTIPKDFNDDIKIDPKKTKEEYLAEWDKDGIFYGSEKKAQPGFLEPKRHPAELCMPCCFAYSPKPNNIDKCTNVNIDYIVNDSSGKYSADDLTVDSIINKHTLYNGNTVLLLNKKPDNGFYTITED